MDDLKYEWGPWIEHDGWGCPVRGQYVDRVLSGEGLPGTFDCGGKIKRKVGIVEKKDIPAWDWKNFGKRSPSGKMWARVLRYRVRPPRVTEWLQSIPLNIKEPVDA